MRTKIDLSRICYNKQITTYLTAFSHIYTCIHTCMTGILMHETPIIMEQGKVMGNFVTVDGGGVCLRSSSFLLLRCGFEGNQSYMYGSQWPGPGLA